MVKVSKKTLFIVAGVTLCLIILVVWQVVSRVEAEQEVPFDWRSDWAVAEGFALSIDTEGYHLPTAIAFVPQPGSGPKDPLYFITELRGRVKVITNDRSVYTFAEDFFQLQPEKELPEFEGETGLAGICLAPEQGYVFVTFAYEDAEGILRNNIMRFESKPQTFSLEPTGQLAFTDLFDEYEAAISHQIGSCQVADDTLYVSVADGWQFDQSQKVDSLLGKVLRMTLDGQPAPDNPFHQDGDTKKAADFVWAYGFRNPFGLKAVGDRLFVADNGSDIDRFLEVRAGENYLWNGSDWSIGARADVALAPDVGPAQVDYYPRSVTLFPNQYRQSFFVATSKPEEAGVLRIGYSLDKERALGAPEYFLKYQGTPRQFVVGVAFGPDGLYFVPILPDAEGRSAIFKVAYSPDEQHPFLMIHTKEPESLMREKGCFGCHQLNSEGGTDAPPLDQRPMVDRLETRLNSEAYIEHLAEIDRLDREPFRSFREARVEVLQAENREKLRTWMIYHIMEPRFDNPYSQMPNLGLSKTEATVITDYLLKEKSFTERGKEAILQVLPASPLPRHLFFAFGGGFVAGALLLAVFLVVKNKLAIRERRVVEGGHG